MTPYYDQDGITIYHGDCRDVLPLLSSVDAVVTSPPYAEQRASQYDSVPEVEYPAFTVDWMDATPLATDGSIIVNIRSHLRGMVREADRAAFQCGARPVHGFRLNTRSRKATRSPRHRHRDRRVLLRDSRSASRPRGAGV